MKIETHDCLISQKVFVPNLVFKEISN